MTIAEKITRAKSDYDDVYDAGYEKGKAEGGGNDAIQYITNLYRLFEGAVFPENLDLVLNPKYQSLANFGCYNTFKGAKNLKSAKIIYDRPTDKAIDMQSMFREISTLETVDLSEFNNLKPSTVAWMFLATTQLKSVYGALDFSECTSATIWLNGATALVDMEFVPNTIKISIDFYWCTKLTKSTIESIINGLATDTSGLTVTLSKTAVNNAFETTAGAADGSASEEWLNLISEKQNWTISLS